MYVIVCKHTARYSVKITCPKNQKKWKIKMSEEQLRQLQRQLWSIADALRGKMNADEFRDYILGFIWLCRIKKHRLILVWRGQSLAK